MTEIIIFPGGRTSQPSRPIKPRRRYKPYPLANERSERKEKTYLHSGLNMRRAAFRNREAIVEATEEDLIRDVGLEMEKAQSRLTRLQARLANVRAEAEFLAQAEIKLRAAIVAALLSTREG